MKIMHRLEQMQKAFDFNTWDTSGGHLLFLSPQVFTFFGVTIKSLGYLRENSHFCHLISAGEPQLYTESTTHITQCYKTKS